MKKVICRERRPRRSVKRIMSIILSFLMLFSITAGIDFSAYALSSNGSCGTNVTYTYTNNNGIGVLTISGSGAINNYGLSSSNKSPFLDNKYIQYIIIKNGVTSIGSCAFYGCTGLTSITIPDSVTSIGSYAFSGCTGLTSITIPDSVTTINQNAFDGCSGLTSITIPDGVTSIGDYAFSGCGTIIYPGTANGSPWGAEARYNIIENSFAYTDNKKTKLAKYLGNDSEVVIPDSVTSIGSSTFANCTRLKNITIPNGVTSIGDHAFSDCRGLTSITIPDSVKSIGNNVFSNCRGLTSITIPDSVKSIAEYAFYYCSSLTSVTIGNGVSSIGDYAFYNCNRLKELTMPCSAKIFQSNNTFYNCVNIEKITLTKGTGTTQNYGTDSSTTVTYYKYTPWYISGFKTLVIEDGVTSIGNNTFYGCTGLTSVTIPASVSTIGGYAFYGCTGLTSITIPDSVTSIGSSAFSGCIGLTSVTIPDSVTSVGGSAFSGCTGLTSVTIPDSVKKSIGSYVFSGCTGLTSLTIGNGVTSIGNYAFDDCSGLTRVNISDLKSWCNISFGNSSSNPLSYAHNLYLNGNLVTDLIVPKSVKSIGNYAFYGCSGLTSVTIPDSVTSIGNSAFYNCKGLTNVNIGTDVKSIDSNSFKGCNRFETIYLYSKVIDSTQNLVSCMPSDSTIYAYPSTDAQTYCSIYGVNFVPFDEPRCDEGIHTYVETVSKEATCEEEGSKQFKCRFCENEYDETIPAFGHKPVTDYCVEPSCTETGLTEGSHCSVCNKVLTAQNEIPANGHNYETVVIKPTCKDRGYTTHTCSVCGDEYVDTYTDITEEHNYVSTVIAPTCAQQGFTLYECSICSDIYKSDFTPATGEHNYESVVTKPSTCTERGVNTFTCSVCGDKYISYISMKSHSAVVDAAVAPTCTKTGLTAGSHCRDCGAVITAQEVVNAKGHSYTSVVTAPTCKEQGYTTYTCSVCGDSYKGDFTAVTDNHNYKSTVTTPATCTAKGVKTFTCSICGDKYTEDIEMKAHTAVTDKAVAATCTKPGLTQGSHCSVCGTVIVEQTVIPAKQHNYVPVVTAPTCRDKGYTTYTCSVCQDSYRADYTDRTNDHDYKGVVTKLPTCTSEGVKTFTCSVCNDTYTEPVEKIAHTPATDSAVAPTGTSTGLTEGSHCSVCGEVLVAQQVVPALIPEGATVKLNGDKAVITLSDGSTITVPKDTKETVKNADGTYTVTLNDGKSVTVSSNTEITKTADGQLNVKATDNGKTTTVTVPSGSSVVKSGDSYKVIVVNGTETVEKTVAAGETVVIDKSGSMSCNGNHKWDKGVVTISATCTSEGVKTYTCSVCGNQKIEKLKKVAHKPVADKAVPATFVSAGKTAGTHCSVCGKTIVAQKPVAMLGAAKLSKVKKGKKSFTATWKPVANVDGYEIQYSLKKNMKKAKTKSVASSKKKLKVKKLKAKKKYYVRIRAYKVINGKKQYSAWSAKKKVKTK